MATAGYEDKKARIYRQLDIVRTALAQEDVRDGETFPGIAIAYTEVDGEPRYVYQDCGILVRDEYESLAARVLGATVNLRRVNGEQRGRDGRYQLLDLPEPGALVQLKTLTDACGHSGAGALNHIMSITADGGANLCPADEPGPTSLPPLPPPATGDGGHGVRIRVIDTGLVPEAATLAEWTRGLEGGTRYPPGDSPALAALVDRSRPPIVGAPPLESPPDFNVYYAHGTFIAGVIRCVAPAADVYVANDFRQAGALTEINLVQALRTILTSDDCPDIISLSAGAYFESGENLPALKDVVTDLQARARREGRPVLVAAAGNDGRNERFLPAAMDGVISVGALRENLRDRACFSNHGPWVRVWAPGERLVNVFPRGTYAYYHRPVRVCRYIDPGEAHFDPACTCIEQHADGKVTFDGSARWSGTSFATPIVAGLIAVRMTEHHENARDAADRLLNAEPGNTLLGVGRTLLPVGFDRHS